jgi:hypothetical protein
LFAHAIALSQLDVKGCPNIYESFNKYTETEMLDGANQYMAEGYGLQVGQWWIPVVGYARSLKYCQTTSWNRDSADPHNKRLRKEQHTA